MEAILPWPDEPFSRADLPRLGRSESDLRRAQRRGDICAVVRGVFVPAGLDDTIAVRAAAVIKAAGPEQIATDRTAGWLHQIDAYTYAEHDGPPPIETCALRWRAPTTLAGIDGRTRELRAEDVMILHGVRVTTPLRTALDLGCCLRRREAFAALCGFARLHDLTRHDYRREVPRFRRRRGVVQLRELIELVDPRVESQREAWVLLAIADAEIPLPEPQHWITIDGVATYRLDFAYPRRRVCVEYDGHDAHDSDEQKEYDKGRRQWLRDNGWTVIVVRDGGFTGDALDLWLEQLRAALIPTYSNRRW